MTTRKISRNSSAVHDINYHLIFVTKYRKQVLNGDTADVLEQLLRGIAARRRLEIISLSIQPEHVHLFISADPFQTPCAIVKSFKGEAAFKLFKECPSLRLHLWKGTLWSPGYWVSTAGSISSETVEKYIEEQRNG